MFKVNSIPLFNNYTDKYALALIINVSIKRGLYLRYVLFCRAVTFLIFIKTLTNYVSLKSLFLSNDKNVCFNALTVIVT